MKPAYFGMCILDFIKVLMYEFHYDYIKNKCGNNSRLWLTETNSLIYEIKTEDVYEDFSKNKEMFDFSYYSLKSKYYDVSNKLLVGKMKDGAGDAAIEKFVGLSPRMHSFPGQYKTLEMWVKKVDTCPFVFDSLPDWYKTYEMGDKVVLREC